MIKIDHVALYVNDLEGTREFFIRYFNAISNEMYHNSRTGFRSYFLTFEDGARLEIMNKPQLRDDEKHVNRTGYIHLSFSVGSKEQVDTLSARLDADGYTVIDGPRQTGDGYYESCVVGFEGNLIEITI